MSRFKKMMKRINWYPPYLGAGIKVAEHNADFTMFRVEMKLQWYNKNLIGTHFGGSMYSMCDPFYMFILILNLGDDYIVWDKSGCIDFTKPGRGTIHAIFEISAERIEEIRQEVEEKGKGIFPFSTQILDEAGDVVADVRKEVYVRRKKPS